MVTLPPSQLEGIAALPAEKDWSGEMNPVKDQEACGSCWAFATNAIVEFALGAKGRGVVNPAELMDKSLRMHPYADSDDGHCRAGADAVDRKCGGSGACEGLTSLAGLDILKCEPGSVHLWPDAQAEAEMYEEYFHCLKDGPNSCKYANDGECDDGGVGSEYSMCYHGEDCADCGTRDAPPSPPKDAPRRPPMPPHPPTRTQSCLRWFEKSVTLAQYMELVVGWARVGAFPSCLGSLMVVIDPASCILVALGLTLSRAIPFHCHV